LLSFKHQIDKIKIEVKLHNNLLKKKKKTSKE
jgi:hypothetical protein